MTHDFGALIDALPGLVWTASPDGVGDYFNHQWHEYTGRSTGEAGGEGWQAAIHPEDLGQLLQRWRAIATTKLPGELRLRIWYRDVGYRWFRVRSHPLNEQSTKIVNWCALGTDIDDRTLAAEILHAPWWLTKTGREAHFRAIGDSMPIHSFLVLPSGELELVGRRSLEYFGKSFEEVKHNFLELMHPDDREHVLAVTNNSDATYLDFDCRLRRADGVFRWFNTREVPLRDQEGNVVLWYGLQVDIDDRKRAEDELRRSETFLAEAQRLSRTGSFLWYPMADELVWSAEMYRIAEMDQSVVPTRELFATRIHPDDAKELAEMQERARLGNPDYHGRPFEFRLRMPDQRIKYVAIHTNLVTAPDGQLQYIGALQDVTARRAAEEALAVARSELEHMARVTSLGALTASITHEVSQPLSGIITNASTCQRMLAAETPNIENVREIAQRIIRDGNRASDVIKRLRTLFAKREAALEILDLNEIVRDVIALSSSELHRSRIALQQEFAEDLPSILGDRIQLQQVILNLLLNAKDAMNGIFEHPRHLMVKTSRDEHGNVCVGMADTGVGFERQHAEKLFDAFYTTKSSGMGIGLSVSRSIIESHSGRLWAVQNDGPGATFLFSIPGTTASDARTRHAIAS